MAFLDRLGAGARPMEMTELQRVAANLSMTDNQIAQKVSQLGQAYYTDHKDDGGAEEKYRSLMDDIRKLEENRKGFLEYKLRLEGNFMCVNCGQIIPLGSVYCAFCGKRADVRDESIPNAHVPGMQKVCQVCGALVEDGNAAFCPSCGAGLITRNP